MSSAAVQVLVCLFSHSWQHLSGNCWEEFPSAGNFIICTILFGQSWNQHIPEEHSSRAAVQESITQQHSCAHPSFKVFLQKLHILQTAQMASQGKETERNDTTEIRGNHRMFRVGSNLKDHLVPSTHQPKGWREWKLLFLNFVTNLEGNFYFLSIKTL